MRLYQALLIKFITSICFIIMLCSNVHAQNMQKLGSMNVHYMAIGATFLTPKVAKAYNIERSRYNALINVSVLDNTKSGHPAQSVSITGNAKNNVGQLKEIAFKEVVEGNAIYYLAEVNYSNEETLHFNLTINNGFESHQLNFSQTFYVD